MKRFRRFAKALKALLFIPIPPVDQSTRQWFASRALRPPTNWQAPQNQPHSGVALLPHLRQRRQYQDEGYRHDDLA
jgi:hypothetical protein